MAAESQYKVPLSSPDITAVEVEAVNVVLQSRWLSMGSETQNFEDTIAAYAGVEHALTVNSGTAGLHLCVRAAGIGPGDLVITTPFSFVASSNVLLFERAIPVFVDVDPASGNIDVAQVRQAVDDLKTGGAAAAKWLPRKGAEAAGELKAILPVDVFGQPADLDPLLAMAEDHNLKIIEDACEAIGAEYKGSKAGSQADYAVFAFYPNKQMTTGEGGMVVTNDAEAAAFMSALRNQGRAPGDTWLAHTHLGYNYRLDEISAALGHIQATRLDEMLAKRAQVAEWYEQRLGDLALVETPQILDTTTRMSWFVYVVRVTPEIDRDALIHKLAERGIPARPYFAPIHLQPFMVEQFGYQEGDYPVTEDLGKRGLAIPFSSVMTEAQVEIVCQELAAALED
ncbi:MAG: DegT/DnrJ/EryC1/StrS family aminotransferase [Anaerolineales bacterium]|nr:DegT/DnrJ/EryC1/StrS family aminotransferase [Anaerolineales bacterium]